MEKLLQEFMDIIARQNEVLDQIAETGRQKQQIIIAGKVKELDSLIQKEGILISTLEKLEGARFKLQQEISSGWAAEGTVSAGQLLAQVKQNLPHLSPEMETVLHRLSFNLARLKAINDHNNELIEHSLQYIQTLQAVMNGDVAGTYSDKGRPADEGTGRRVNLLDTRA